MVKIAIMFTMSMLTSLAVQDSICAFLLGCWRSECLHLIIVEDKDHRL